MSLLRFVARSLFAGQFIADGVRAVAHPAEIAPDAERLTSTIAPLVQRVVPAHLASSVPENTETWVRMIGAAQIVGGAMFATGLGRRLGAGLLTATSAATVLPTIRSRCAAYTIAPVPAADCAARLKAERLPAKAAEELAFLYEGHIGTALKSWNDPTAKAALGMAKTLCGYAAQGDTYRALALLTKYERDKDGFAALLWTLDQLCSAVLRRPAYGQEQCGGLTPAGAAKILNADARARKSLTGNGNLRLNVAVLAGEIA